MNDKILLELSLRWFRLLVLLYPPDFRDEMGDSLVQAYMDDAHDRLRFGRNRKGRLIGLWFRVLLDSVRSGIAERIRPAVAWRRAGDWGRDIELVHRRLVRSPMFTASTIATLAVGLGMFAVVFTAVQRVLIDPMPYKDAGDLYYVWRDYGPIADVSRGALSGTDIAELQRQSGNTSIIEAAAAVLPMQGGVFSLRESSDPIEISVAVTSNNFFDLLGVTPALGRGFREEEAGLGQGTSHVVVLTHHLWVRLGANRAIVGTIVRLQGRPHTVVGVLPAEFTFVRSDPSGPPQRVDAYTPLEVHLKAGNGKYIYFAGVIRARKNASPRLVAEAVDAVGRIIDTREFGGRGLRLRPVGLKADTISRIQPALVVLGAAGVVLLLMLMVNLASALLARVSHRERELAVSRALGANVAAILRATLLEGCLLGLVGGVLSVLFATWGASLIVALAPPDLPRREAIAMDLPIAFTVIGISVLLGLCAAAMPALWATRTSLPLLLTTSAVRGGGGGKSRWRHSLIVTQVALSLVLLSSGALVVRSFEHLLRVDPGFQSAGVFTMKLRTPPDFFPLPTDVTGFQDRVQEALGSIPGVDSTGAASALPLSGSAFPLPVIAPNSSANTGDAQRDELLVDWVGVRAGFVETMGMRLLSGRSFAKQRTVGVTEVMIDNAVAGRFFPNGNALGAQLRVADRPVTVIGIIGHTRLYGLHADGRPQAFSRAEDFNLRPLFYVMRTKRDPNSLLSEVTAAVRSVDPRVPVGDPRTMEELVQAARSPQAIGASLVTGLAVGALLLTAMGLFGVIAESVTRRHHELAIRLAIGADYARILRLVVGEGALLVSAGLLLGLPGIYCGYRVIRGLLIGISPYDPVALATAALGLLVVAMAACYVPARRVLRINPAQMLNQ